MIKIETKFKMNVPNFDFSDDLMEVARTGFIPIMQKNMESSTAIDGSTLPPNAPATLKRKAVKNHGNKPLFDTGKLFSSFIAIAMGKNKVMVTLASERKNIGSYLQYDGVVSRMGINFYRFFGVNKEMELSARDFMNRKVGERINEGRK